MTAGLVTSVRQRLHIGEDFNQRVTDRINRHCLGNSFRGTSDSSDQFRYLLAELGQTTSGVFVFPTLAITFLFGPRRFTLFVQLS